MIGDTLLVRQRFPKKNKYMCICTIGLCLFLNPHNNNNNGNKWLCAKMRQESLYFLSSYLRDTIFFASAEPGLDIRVLVFPRLVANCLFSYLPRSLVPIPHLGYLLNDIVSINCVVCRILFALCLGGRLSSELEGCYVTSTEQTGSFDCQIIQINYVCLADSHFFLLFSLVTGIDFKIRTIELDNKKIKLQIW